MNVISVMKKLYNALMKSVGTMKHVVAVLTVINARIQASTAKDEIKTASAQLLAAAIAFKAAVTEYRDTFYVS